MAPRTPRRAPDPAEILPNPAGVVEPGPGECEYPDMSTDLEILRSLALRHAHGRRTATAIPRITLARSEAPSGLVPVVYDPAFCLVLQGTKRVVIGDQVVQYGRGTHFIATVASPALASIA